ncbi:MAG TPA: hypothetical protein QF800_05460 [Phycisphaerales bacterium]|nr:hypothetical protein [Phycisphaerales bacterium]
MSRIPAIAVLAALCGASFAAAATIDLAYTSFDSSIEGWQVRDTVNNNISYFTPDWMPTGGVPTGHLEFADVTQGGYVFEAPDSFEGDFSQAVSNNGGVSFNWKADMIQAGKCVSLSFDRGGTRLWMASDPDPLAGIWHSFDWTFAMATGWKINYGSGTQVATLGDIQYVLSDVTQMDISGETWTGVSETTWLDNPRIYMQSVPAPGAVALLGLAAATGCRRRRINRR